MSRDIWNTKFHRVNLKPETGKILVSSVMYPKKYMQVFSFSVLVDVGSSATAI